MKEVGESSNSSTQASEIWAKLVPLDSKYEDVEIRTSEIVISSEIKFSSHEKHEWCKITRNQDLCSATMQNKSTSTILVDEAEVQDGDSAIIQCGSVIIPGPTREGYMCYRFRVMPRPETSKELVKICLDVEHVKCSICLNIWHDVVTASPCFHNFCNGCFSEWLRRSQEKRSTVLCPQCRAFVESVGRNHFLHNITEDILQANSSLKRSDQEIAILNSYATIRSNLVIRTRLKSRQKRVRSPLLESVVRERICLQCGNGYGGFCCSPGTVHLQCQACRGMMPSRSDIRIPQHCLGCDRAFCGAYWHSQGFTMSDSQPICSSATFRPMAQRTISRIPFAAHEKNQHEQNITERCIIQMGRTLQDVITEWVGRLDNREIDRSRLPLNHAEAINSATYICNECYDKVVSFLLYWFRIALPHHFLPPDASQRENCWYGYACHTQHHNEDHARKRNHVCRPTRFRF